MLYYIQFMKKKNYIDFNKDTYSNPETKKAYQDRAKNVSEYEWTDEQWKQFFILRAGVNKNSKVLELGPGSGRMLAILASLAKNTTAVEFAMGDIAKEKSPTSTVIEQNILDVELPEGEFDVIYAGAFIHMFSSHDLAHKVMPSISEWLKPGGKFIFTTTLHEKHAEGIFAKEDYEGQMPRFRNKMTRHDISDVLMSGDMMPEEFYGKGERDRDKLWILAIAEKSPEHLRNTDEERNEILARIDDPNHVHTDDLNQSIRRIMRYDSALWVAPNKPLEQYTISELEDALRNVQKRSERSKLNTMYSAIEEGVKMLAHSGEEHLLPKGFDTLTFNMVEKAIQKSPKAQQKYFGAKIS